MGDRSHLSNEKELYDYYNNIYYRQSTESPTTASSASSPMTSIVQNHSFNNWQTTNNTTTTPNYDPPVINQHHYFDSAISQQHYVMTPTRQLQQHHLSYRNPSFMQGFPYQYDPSYHYPHLNYDYVQQHLPFSSHMNTNTYYAHHHQHQHHRTDSHLFNPHEIPSNYTPQQDIPPATPPPVNNISTTTTNDETSININQPQNKKSAEEEQEESSTKIKSSTPSPKTTPLPSPVLPVLKRKRVGHSNNNSRRSSISSPSGHSRGTGENFCKEQQEEGGYGVLKEGDVNQKTVDQLENELAFLRDECATILIMLDSLRNAFMADIPSSSKNKRKQDIQQSTMPLTGTINFLEEDNISSSTLNSFTATHQNNRMNNKPPACTIAQNPDMEREMRTAYDDLMLQVRQLEKKVEKLENKSKNACIIDDGEKKQKKEDQLSQTTSTTSSPLSEEEELTEDDQDNDDKGEGDKKAMKKRKRETSSPTVKKPTKRSNSKKRDFSRKKK